MGNPTVAQTDHQKERAKESYLVQRLVMKMDPRLRQRMVYLLELHSDHPMATNSAPPMDHSMGVPMAQPMALHWDRPTAVGLVMMMEA
jgi:hypothetical protein